MIVKTEGIVLKSFDFRETSRIATFFTRDFGKVKGVLKAYAVTLKSSAPISKNFLSMTSSITNTVTATFI